MDNIARRIEHKLEEIKRLEIRDLERDRAVIQLLVVIYENLLTIDSNQRAIGRITFARLDNIDAQLRAILAGPQVGDAVTGIIALDGVASDSTGGNTMSDSIKDNAPPAGLSVSWSDVKGAIVTNEAVDETWAGDNDAAGTVTPDPADASRAIFTPVAAGVVNVTVKGVNQGSGAEVLLTDVIVVETSDAVAGTITLTPGTAPEPTA